MRKNLIYKLITAFIVIITLSGCGQDIPVVYGEKCDSMVRRSLVIIKVEYKDEAVSKYTVRSTYTMPTGNFYGGIIYLYDKKGKYDVGDEIKFEKSE